MVAGIFFANRDCREKARIFANIQSPFICKYPGFFPAFPVGKKNRGYHELPGSVGTMLKT
jgi:hypothetical protein